MTDVEPEVVDVSTEPDDVQEPFVEDVTEPTDAEVVDAVEDQDVGGQPIEDSAPAAFSPQTIGRARDYGLSESDLEGMDSAKVERMFSAIDRRIMRPQEPVSGAQPPAPQAGPRGPVTGQYVPLKLEHNDDVDESVTKHVQTVVDHVNESMQGLHTFRQQMMEEVQAINTLRELGDFDRFVGGLGDEWTSVYGSGATVDMDPQSAEFRARMDVFQGAKTLRDDATRRRQPLALADAHLRSHRGVNWDRIEEHSRASRDDKVKKRRNASAERPTRGKTAAMSPKEEAIAAWQ
jgi:hypothetical protein